MIHNHGPAVCWRVVCGYTSRPAAKMCEDIMDPAEVTRLIETGLPDATVRVMSDDNTHFEALVVAAQFSGKRLLARHQMVYKCLGSLVGNEIHALSIIAMTPEEWREKSALE